LKTIIIDADGPLFDGQEKHTVCYRSAAQSLGFSPIESKLYWQLKREKTPLTKILSLSQAESFFKNFEKYWEERIESPEFLAFDRLQPKVLEKLKDWRASGHRLVLASLRQNPDRLREQLNGSGLLEYFQAICVTRSEQGAIGKAEAVKKKITSLDVREMFWIGDTEVDIDAARSIGCPIWALTCGLRSLDFLFRLKPDYLSDTIGAVDPQRVWVS
jgi:phosphoglycolate phosphatase